LSRGFYGGIQHFLADREYSVPNDPLLSPSMKFLAATCAHGDDNCYSQRNNQGQDDYLSSAGGVEICQRLLLAHTIFLVRRECLHLYTPGAADLCFHLLLKLDM
jgi:hypothetical protein